MESNKTKTNESRNSKAVANQRFGKNGISFTPVQRTSTPDERIQFADGDLKTQLNVSKGTGSILPDEARLFMEQRFGADFSQVQIHADSEADDMNRQVSAHAFTHNQDIYFRAGKYNPESAEGKRLLAHELTHVMQQSLGPVEGTPIGGLGLSVSDPSDRFEREAKQMADDIMSNSTTVAGYGETTSTATQTDTSVQRDSDGDESIWDTLTGPLVSGAGKLFDLAEIVPGAGGLFAGAHGIMEGAEEGGPLGGLKAAGGGLEVAGGVGEAALAGGAAEAGAAGLLADAGPLGLALAGGMAGGSLLYNHTSVGGDTVDSMGTLDSAMNWMTGDDSWAAHKSDAMSSNWDQGNYLSSIGDGLELGGFATAGAVGGLLGGAADAASAVGGGIADAAGAVWDFL